MWVSQKRLSKWPTKRCSTLLIPWKLQMKTMKYQRYQKGQKWWDHVFGEEAGLELSFLHVGGVGTGALLGKTVGHGPLKLNILVTADLATPSLQTQSHAHQKMNGDVQSSTIHNNQEQETTQKPISRSSHRMEFYKAMRMDDLTTCNNTDGSYTQPCTKAAGHAQYTLCDSPAIELPQRHNIWGDQDGGYRG